jgi:hypothetical protein
MKKFGLISENNESNILLKKTHTKEMIEFYKMDFEEKGMTDLKIIELDIDD